jgi:RNA polymerase sigma-70 factor, ECF subfamily
MQEADEALVTAARGGDEGALAALLSRCAPAVYRFGLKMCADTEDAKDVLQDTLIAAAHGLRDFRGASSLSTWLYTVARSFCIKKRRRSKFAPEIPLSLERDEVAARAPAPGPLPDEAAAARERSMALDAAIHSLEPAQREVLVLRDIEGLTAPEVAEVLRISIDAVKSRLHRARAHVRGMLETSLGSEDKPASPASRGGCPDIVSLFSRHLEGEIGPELCERMERHVAACPRCDAVCTSLKQTLALCRAERAGNVPGDVQERVRRALRALEATAR